MAKTLLIYANPNMGGHCHAILESVKKQLAEKNVEYTFVDLNAEKFDPVTHADELYTTGGTATSEQTKKYMAQITEAEKIIFVYPVWWNTMPAILKGYFDKVFQGRFAFRYIKKPYLWFAYPVGMLKGKKAVVFTTTGGRWWMTLLAQHNNYKSLIKRDLLGFFGIKSKVYTMHNCLQWDESKKPKIDSMVKSGLGWHF